MKRVLIITGSSGFGHNSVAMSLREAIGIHVGSEVQTEILDLLSLNGVARLCCPSRLYGPVIVRAPDLWGPIYHLTNRRSYWNLFRRGMGLAIGNCLSRCIIDQQPDVIVCVHPLANQVAAIAIERIGARLPLVAVPTDLGEAHAAWFTPQADLYLAPTEEVACSLVRQGAIRSRVKVTGLPIRAEFCRLDGDRLAARRQLGLEESRFTAVVCGGGEGAGRIETTVRGIRNSRLPVQLLVICGRNEGLRKRLAVQPFSGLVLGFTEHISQHIRAAEVVVGKAGALTIGEAVAAGRPLIVLASLPGQEAGNVQFVRQRGIGRAVANPREVVEVLHQWSVDRTLMGGYVARARPLRRQWIQASSAAAEAIIEVMDIIEVMEKKEARCSALVRG